MRVAIACDRLTHTQSKPMQVHSQHNSSLASGCAALRTAHPNVELSSPKRCPIYPQPENTVSSEASYFVSEVAIRGVEGEQLKAVQRVIQTRTGQRVMRSQIQSDIQAIFAVGDFSHVQAIPERVGEGDRILFVVQLNPVLKSVQLKGRQVLPKKIIQTIFADQYGKPLNLNQFQAGIQSLNQWYQENRYSLATITHPPQVTADGTVILQVAEGVVKNTQIKFLNTRKQLIQTPQNLRQLLQLCFSEAFIKETLQIRCGQAFHCDRLAASLRQIHRSQWFRSVHTDLRPDASSGKVELTVNVVLNEWQAIEWEGIWRSFSPGWGMFINVILGLVLLAQL